MVEHRKLPYEDPVTPVELSLRRSGSTGRRLRDRLDRTVPGRDAPADPATDAESLLVIEQAAAFLAELREVSIDEARDLLLEDAASRDLTVREAAERILSRRDDAGGGPGR
jgi:hypothetical protein